MEIFFVLLFIAVAAGLWKAYKNTEDNKLAIRQFEHLTSIIPNFNYDKAFTHPNGSCFIALDDTNKQIILARKLPAFDIRMAKHRDKVNPVIIDDLVVGYDEVLKTEIIIDGQTVSSKSISRALVGGALFGTVGAIVGSNTGTTTFSKNVNSITLKLLIKDVQNPSFELPFYNKKDDPKGMLPRFQQLCQTWHDTLTVALA